MATASTIMSFYFELKTHHTTAPRALRANSLPSPGIKPKGSKTKQGTWLVYLTTCLSYYSLPSKLTSMDAC